MSPIIHISSSIRPISHISLRWLLPMLLMFLHAAPGQAQIKIGGNIYGGGNAGDTGGKTTVTVHAGDLNKVFGGARMADVDGSAFVHIDGEHASDYILINYVYGGNDISGTIGKLDKALPTELTQATENGITTDWDAFVRISSKMNSDVHYTQAECDAYNSANKLTEGQEGFKTTSDIKTPANTYVADDNQMIYIGQLFGGGNGDYVYKKTTTGEGTEAVTTYSIEDKDGNELAPSAKAEYKKPELANTYLEILGGSIVYAYGGGNNATVTNSTVICYDNPSIVVYSIKNSSGTELLNDERFAQMGINYRFSQPKSDEFQVGRFFGGNNSAEMAIRPIWNLKRGSIRDLYSGGNKGNMTSRDGLLLEIAQTSTIKVDNLYGGCRMADVDPRYQNSSQGTVGERVSSVPNIPGYKFPDNLAARVLVRGGDVNNVYGGNDVRGKVYFGNAVGVYTSIRGNIYGGGNGSYPYTDNPDLANDLLYGDFYYNPIEVLDLKDKTTGEARTTFTQKESAEALKLVRPNAEQVSIRVYGGEDDTKPIIIRGSIYCGGNSATLKDEKSHTSLPNYPLVELKIGSNIIADKVFLGCNGENMITEDLLKDYAGNVTDADYDDEGTDDQKTAHTHDFSSLDLTEPDIFKAYMDGCAMDLIPSVNFDSKKRTDPATYKPYSSYIGSFYCGGNVGSMTYEGTNKMDFSVPVYIYDKVVGGCNNAIVTEKFIDGKKVNALYVGGIRGTTAEQEVNGGYSFTDQYGNIQNRLVMSFGNKTVTTDSEGNETEATIMGIQFTPKRWNDDNTALVWNTVDGNGVNVPAVTETVLDTQKDEEGNDVLDEEGNPVKLGYALSSDEDLERRLKGGHIYGGCYTSGIVNGNVVINLNSSTVNRDLLFDEVEEDNEGEASLYGESQLTQDKLKYHITKRRTGVILDRQGMDVFGQALNVFGGGKGKDTEIWGSTTINLLSGYSFQVFGGSEEGVIGRSVSSGGTYTFGDGETIGNGQSYKYDPKYSCTVNLCGDNAGVSKQDDSSEDMAECEFIYGGGFFGPICGNTTVNLGKGRVFNTFAGSCMADILGHTETYIGRQVKDGTVTEGFPYVRDIVYGGNDLGGKILGELGSDATAKAACDFTNRVRTTDNGGYDAIGKVHNTDLLTASAYIEYTQGRADAIFGGCYGTYNYKDSHYNKYFNSDGTAKSDDYSKPRMGNAFVNFRPTLTDALKSNAYNTVHRVYGAGQGYPGDADRDIMQRSSYILIDIPQTMEDKEGDVEHYRHMEVFGGGAWSGVGMQQKIADGTTDLPPVTFNTYSDKQKDLYSANIDLARGYIGAAYGGSLSEGVVRRTWVNVPTGSTIQIGSIFAGAYGTATMSPCDVIEGHVEYHSKDALLVNDLPRPVVYTDKITQKKDTVIEGNALMKGAIYGGNNQQRRTIYGKINIDVPVRQKHYEHGMTTGTVYGAGYGSLTWNEYTEVNLKHGAKVYEVYGGGEAGSVMSAESVEKYIKDWKPNKDDDGSNLTDARWNAAWTLGGGYDEDLTSYHSNPLLNLSNDTLVRTAEMDNRSTKTYKYNTNVLIHEGAYVGNYAYGGGRGKEGDEFYGSGDVYGTTYIALLGGTVNKDIYAAGTLGAVYNLFGGDFTASANAYIAGGTARNVYGGGWEGDVGHHPGTPAVIDEETKEEIIPANPNSIVKDVLGETNVVIGIRPDQIDDNLLKEIQKVKGSSATKADYGFLCGVPAIQRNAYSGGEGGAVFGTANLVLNNGYIGYVHLNAGEEQDGQGNIVTTETATETNSEERYEDKINDETYFVEGTWKGAERLKDCGNMFGGGYDVQSSVDFTNVTIWNGTIRNSVHGGGEIATVGRGSTKEAGATRTLNAIYKPGKTTVTMYNGHVLRNVFGGGKGYNIWGYGEQGTLYTDGYVFGQTEVQIHGGEIGTVEGVADGYGNVFGGGDIGYVYSKGFFNSASRITGTGSPGHSYYYSSKYKKEEETIEETTYQNLSEEDKALWTEQTTSLTEDCKVVIAPYLQVKAEGENIIGSKTYNQYEYVETDVLNELPKKDETTEKFEGDWLKLDTGTTDDDTASSDEDNEDDDDLSKKTELERGITIHNAVFGGGNVSSNSDQTYANATTVYGNTTATIYDVYHRDFITVGTEHTGGLYGGGNLSLVDGYRELNITNYGTDYYGLESQITLEQYRALSSRERAYFQLEYICNSEKETNGSGKTGITINGQWYETGTRVSEEDYLKLLNNPNTAISTLAKSSFTPYGFCSIYAGRLLNTIQRADMCGVYGSRMVLQGSRDRVADVADDTEYTINRVGELSLNLQRSVAGDTDTGEVRDNEGVHGNYFGIYSLVNYLGNLTSDVKFGDPYVNKDGKRQTDGTTYYSNKSANPTSSSRNYGQSNNQVALASGVFLELTTENSTEDDKDYGYITGVVELDLINVRKDDVGGGFVYAKNEHRVPMYYPNKPNVILSEYNHQKKVDGKEIRDEARTYKRYRYADATHNVENNPLWDDKNWPETYTSNDEKPYVISGDDAHKYQTMTYQTSGNFIHYKKEIVDDCYPVNNAYIIGSDNFSEAHYWYVKGKVYIYDQKVSAYVGSASAYSRAVHLPLTITAASFGKLQLVNVKPNLYAYKTVDDNGNPIKIGTTVDNKTYDHVWVNNDNDGYTLNEVVTWWDWHQMSAADRQYFVTETFVNTVACTIDGKEYAAGEYVLDETDLATFKAKKAEHTIVNGEGDAITDLDDLFRSSNNIGHDTGYLLTLDMDTPEVWDDRYIHKTSTSQKTKKEYKELTDNSNWIEGPTFTPAEDGVYGMRTIEQGDVVTTESVTNSTTEVDNPATMEAAYVSATAATYTYKGQSKTTNAGTAIPYSEWNELDATTKALFTPAFLCTQTVKLDEQNYLLYGELKTQGQIDELKESYSSLTDDITAAMKQASICTQEGNFGGQSLTAGINYSALDTWCLFPENDRIDSNNGNYKFNYNYDAFDVLSDPTYLDGSKAGHDELYLNPDRSVTVDAYRSPYTDQVSVEYDAVFHAPETDPTMTVSYTGGTVSNGGKLSRAEYETVRNDKRHYTHVSVKAGGETLYFAKESFTYNGTPYGMGQEVTQEIADDPNYSSKVQEKTFDNPSGAATVLYYRYETYPEDPYGTDVITADQYSKGSLVNYQQYFTIQGKEPTETTTLYVSRDSEIKDVLSNRVYTVVYQYTYYEDEDDGSIKQTNELHVINIRLELESGAPTVGMLYPPGTVLPGSAVGLTRPDVQPGLYEVLTNGWELFNDENDARHHRNGSPFVNNSTPVYWYQNQKNYVAFYSKTYLGKTYSNPVPLSVANYHDLDAVMADKEHHYYVDHPNVDRASKIYIDDRACESDPDKSELDLLKDFFDLSLLSSTSTGVADGVVTADGALKDHALLDSHVRAGQNLEFILSSDVSPKAYAATTATPAGTGWTPIGSGSDPCFSGTLHGDGHTISGLDHSLFDKLCGEVYNLGVTGSFTGAGIAETGEGYVENCWVKSSAVSGFPAGTAAVFGNPTRDASDSRGPVQVVNCYYPASNTYTVPASTTHGQATQMSDRAFYNGEVAYNLNGFYLKKRYYDHTTLDGSAVEYNYLPTQGDGTLPDDMSQGSYPADYALYQPDVVVEENETLPYLGYVENRFYDGDFVYAGGNIPESNNIRMRSISTTDQYGNATTKRYYTPIWPDDYIFFGQALNYGHDGRIHQAYPAAINKSSGRTATDATGNRVYRAPAYYGSSQVGVAHFNPAAVFAAEGHKDMTAIDFTGYHERTASAKSYNSYEEYDAQTTFSEGLVKATTTLPDRFYPPLLDDDGLTGFINAGLTKNLLVYTLAPGTTSASEKTGTVVSTYLHDKAYNESDSKYRTVDAWDRFSGGINGHWVQGNGSTYTAPYDHMLVDREDFNAPIAYQMGSEKRMWYQRQPDPTNHADDTFVDKEKGWQGISLPFTAELVTTQQKGELTHFYNGSTTGHEYWLRQFKGNLQQKKKADGTDETGVYTADFNYPGANDGSPAIDKTVDNTFLWDYYYEGEHDHKDWRGDTYQTYYNESRTYTDYPLLTAGTPYIIGFPGKTYYEFDLSGKWNPETTGTTAPELLKAQVITFASEAGESIAVSDTQTTGVTHDGYTFKPSYLRQTFNAGTADTYTLNVEGSSYGVIPAASTDPATTVAPVVVDPFRPYFVSTSGARSTRSIVFGMGSGQFGVEEQGDQGNLDESLTIGARRHAVVVTSNLRTEAEVRITNLAGITVATFTLQPGETIRTPMNADGVYIVRADNGRYQKKLVVK